MKSWLLILTSLQSHEKITKWKQDLWPHRGVHLEYSLTQIRVNFPCLFKQAKKSGDSDLGIFSVMDIPFYLLKNLGGAMT